MTDGTVNFETSPEHERPALDPHQLQPVAAAERIISIDVLRGFALLGILVINIQVFGLPPMNIFNPLIAGGFKGGDFVFWWVSQVFFLQKFMAIFSMLFGAGIVLMGARADSHGRSPRGAFYRRQLWLLVIGLLHAYLLWLGDILVSYALCGMAVYPFRRRSARFLSVLGFLVIMIGAPMSYGTGFFFEKMRSRVMEIREAEVRGETPDAGQERILRSWEELRRSFDPAPHEVRGEVEIYRDGYAGIVQRRAPQLLMMQTIRFVFFIFWRVAGLMLLGMGLMKFGVLSAKCSRRFYAIGLLLGYGIGLPLVMTGAQRLIEQRFDFVYLFKFGQQYNYIGSLFVSFAHVCLVMLACRAGTLRWLQNRLSAVGRMALTNYLVHTAVFTTIFFGYGLGLFARFPRVHLAWFVCAMWIVQLVYSPAWLRRFRFGPCEWLWRSLTYRKRQPMRVNAVER